MKYLKVLTALLLITGLVYGLYRLELRDAERESEFRTKCQPTTVTRRVSKPVFIGKTLTIIFRTEYLWECVNGDVHWKMVKE